MGLWTEEQIEAWLTPETRWIESSDGSLKQVTYTSLVWQGYDELLDAGYTHAVFLQYAEKPGWDPPDLPFEDRFCAIISDTHNRWKRRNGG